MDNTDDIAPKLLEKITNSFEKRVEADEAIKEFRKKLLARKANQIDVTLYERKMSSHASDALQEYLIPENLPNGKLYYNIADRTVTPTIKKVQSLSVDASKTVIKQQYENSNIGISVKDVDFNDERINTFVNKLVNTSMDEDQEKIQELLKGPFENICESVLEDFNDTQAKHVSEAGLTATITRTPLGKCCAWCEEIAGTYNYADAPKDVYRRHDNCSCVTLYRAEKKIQDVWSKKTFQNERQARIAKEQELIKKAKEKDTERIENIKKLLLEDSARNGGRF